MTELTPCPSRHQLITVQCYGPLTVSVCTGARLAGVSSPQAFRTLSIGKRQCGNAAMRQCGNAAMRQTKILERRSRPCAVSRGRNTRKAGNAQKAAAQCLKLGALDMFLRPQVALLALLSEFRDDEMHERWGSREVLKER